MKFNSLPSNEYIVEGLSALSEYCRHKPQSIKRIFYTSKYKEKVQELIGNNKIPLELIADSKDSPRKGERREFEPKSPVYARVEIHYQSFANVLNEFQKSSEHKIVLALDHITDPRNLGAIARSAAFFGVKYILIPKMRQVLLTGASVATSQGAFAYSELVLVSNLNQSLEKLKELGYWVICADAEGEAFESVVKEYEKVILLLGSEGDGVSSLLKKKSDRIVSIGSQNQVLDSLNVSVAAGILLNGFASQFPRSNR